MASKRAWLTTNKAAQAFTLIELLLTVSLIVLLAGSFILSLDGLDSGARLEQGAAHLQTLFRYARGQAANTGRHLRIVFGPEAPAMAAEVNSTNAAPSLSSTNSGIQVLWESDPLGAPGRFEPFPGAEMLIEQVNELVKILEVNLPGSTPPDLSELAFDPLLEPPPPPAFENSTNLTLTVDSQAMHWPTLDCYPDGSSDSLQVVLGAASGEDRRHAVVMLWGVSGASMSRFISTETNTDWAINDMPPSDMPPAR